MLAGEKKFLDVYTNATVEEGSAIESVTFNNNFTPNQGGTDLGIHSPPVGSTPSSRVGRKIYLWGVYIRLRLEWQKLQTSQTLSGMAGYYVSPKVRVLVVLDMQSNASEHVTLDKVLDGGGGRIANFTNLENTGRFRIMYDKIFSPNYSMNMPISQGAGSSAVFLPESQTNYKINIKPKHPIVVNFDTSVSSQAATACTTNQLRVFVFREHSPVAGQDQEVNAEWQVRTRYTD